MDRHGKDWAGCYAHSRPGADEAHWQTLRAHAEAVAGMAARFAEPFASAEAARLVGRVHDAGKADPLFQAYLRRKGPGCPHACVGAKWLDANVPAVGRLLAYAVDGHHAGLPDGVGGAAALADHLCKAAIPEGVEAEPVANPAALLPGFLRKEGNLKAWLWVKMLYSCLVDADWLDTERFMSPERAAARPKTFDGLPTLLARYRAHMATFRADTPVNRLRADVLRSVLDKAGEAPGLYSLTVPTGGGKTLASLGFALGHAAAHGKRKIVYAIPYSTIIEQTTQTLSDVLGAKNVLEHHAEAKWRGERDEVANPLRQLTENWADVPVVVTTNVQFFESFFSALSSRCRKLHNVAGSVIVLDEAQKLPEAFLAPCAELLRLLVADYGCTVVLCTATQPDLSAFGLTGVRELAPDVDALYAKLRRVDYHLLGRVGWPDLADRVAREPGALCVVNTRQDARDLFAELAKRVGEGAFHLSTWMCPAHRRDVIAEIRRRLAAGLPAHVVSTSLIEAGVDLDFPAVFRALAGLDSLAQAAGRCNREGRLPAHGQVYLFEEPAERIPRFLRKAIQETKQIGHYEVSLHRADSFRRFFFAYYRMVHNRGEEILKKLKVVDELEEALEEREPYGEEVCFRAVSEAFHLIPNMGEQTVFVPYKKGCNILRRAISRGLTKERLKMLRGFTIQITETQRKGLSQIGIVRPLEIYDVKTKEKRKPKEGEPQFYALMELRNSYDSRIGANLVYDSLDPSELFG